MKTRFIEHIGTRAYLRVYWDDLTGKCPHYGYHNAKILIGDSNILFDQELGGKCSDYPPESWPVKCDHCGELVPHQFELREKNSHYDGEDPVKYQVFREMLYNTLSGHPEPGDLFYRDHDIDHCFQGWQNCEGKHLYAILPNGREWDVDGRANNCTMPEDKTHRCWCRHGEPPNITVDKNGHTCQAGAGSIAAGDYHGFLTNGEFTNC